MHIEERERNGDTLYYLAKSYRYAGKVKKARIYLGKNLGTEEITEKRRNAEEELENRVEERKRIGDPLHTVLTPEESEEVEQLEASTDFSVFHLDEEDWQYFTEHFTYDTNAIEGSTVTQEEVENILERDEWPEQRSKSEVAETYGIADAVKHIRETDDELSVDLIKQLHEIVFKNSKPYAGQLRDVNVAITDKNGRVVHRGAPPSEVKSLLEELVAWYREHKKEYSPLVLAAIVHNQFEVIHPFQDGNGRAGRLLLNNILLKHDYPPVNIEIENREEYYHTIRAYQHNHDLRPSIELLLKEYERLKEDLEQESKE